MRPIALRELDARLDAGVLVFNCPCARCKDIRDNPEAERNKLWCDALIRIPIAPQAHGWTCVGGSTIDDLSLQPSILIGDAAKRERGGCEGWHGYLTNGVLAPC